MKYVGLQQQIATNNRKSVLLLFAFPVLVLVMVWAIAWLINFDDIHPIDYQQVFADFFTASPIVLLLVGIWFLIAYHFNAAMINRAAGSETLSRKDNMRVYNLTENLCMSVGMPMPMLRIIESDALNAFASGINEKSYTVTLTRGIINHLNDEELEGVIAHELTHIRNHDVKLLIVTVIFVGIFSFIAQVAFRSLYYGSLFGNSRNKNNNNGKGGGGALIVVIVLIMAAIAYALSIVFKLALSRRREYLADSGAVEMTRNPSALADALSKISMNSHVKSVKSRDVQQMFIDNPPPKGENAHFFSDLAGLLSTHPPIEKRIRFLRNL